MTPLSAVRFWLALAAIAVLTVHVHCFGDYIADDAAITFAYAKNLARGEGLVLNPGVDPVEGYSNFLWLLMVLPFCGAGADPTWPVKALSLVLAVATLLLVNHLADSVFRESRVRGNEGIRGVAAIGLAAFTPFALWAIAGMENALYVFLLVLALVFYLHGQIRGCAAALLGLSLTRVEGLAFAAVFALHYGVRLAREHRAPGVQERQAGAMLSIGYLGYVSWHWWHFRALVPNTYLAKAPSLEVGGMFAELLNFRSEGWRYLWSELVSPYRLLLAAPLLCLPLIVIPAGRGVLLVLLVGTSLVLTVSTGGDFYPAFRLGTVLLPFLFLLLVEGARVATARVRPRGLAIALAVVPLLLICHPILAVTARVAREKPISMAGLRTFRANVYESIASDAGRKSLIIMEPDIGSVAYFTDYPILDLGGLANLHVARFRYYPPLFLDYVFVEIQPDVITLHGVWARHANIPLELIERDYIRLGGDSAGPYAEGTYVKRELRAFPRDDQPAIMSLVAKASQAASMETTWTAVECLRRIRQSCRESGACPSLADLARSVRVRADHHRRSLDYSQAFSLYQVAVLADPRDVVALRRREEMRLAAAAPTVHFALGLFDELRDLFHERLRSGWRPATASEFLDLGDVIRATGLALDAGASSYLERAGTSGDPVLGSAALAAQMEVYRHAGDHSSAHRVELQLRELLPRHDTPVIGRTAEIAGFVAIPDTHHPEEVVVFLQAVAPITAYEPFLRLYPDGLTTYTDLEPTSPGPWSHGEDARLVPARFRIPRGTEPVFMYVGTRVTGGKHADRAGITPLDWLRRNATENAAEGPRMSGIDRGGQLPDVAVVK